MKYRIQDWAGNDLTSYYGLFQSFDDAWSAIYSNSNLTEEDYQEFYVEVVS